MGFIVIEEWGDAVNLHAWHSSVVSAKTFASEREAREEAEKHQPKHGGVIRVIRQKPQVKAKKQKSRKKPPHRETRRR
jgi:hypothetical protein